jgi:hypothetical protein
MQKNTLKKLQLVPIAAAMAAALAAPASFALVIGPISGTAVLNAPLTVGIPIELSQGERADLDCLRVSVTNGERLVPQSQLQLSVTTTGSTSLLRIATTSAITEPLVALQVDVECQGRIGRRYTLFVNPSSTAIAEAPAAGQAAPVVGTAAMQPSPVPGTSVAAAVPNQGGPSAASAQPARSRAAAGVAPGRAAGPDASSRIASSGKSASSTIAPKAGRQARAGTTPTLKVDLLAPIGELASFRLSRDLGAAQQVSADRREELKKLRDALFAELAGERPVSADAGSAALARIAELETSNRQLQAQASGLKAEAERERLARQRIESESFSSTTVYGLGLLLLACLAAMAFLWTRRRDSSASVSESVFAPVGPSPDNGDDDDDRLSPSAVAGTAAAGFGSEGDAPAKKSWWSRIVSGRGKSAAASTVTLASDRSPEEQLAELHQQAKDSIKVNLPSEPDDWSAQSLLTPVEQLAVNEVADLSQEADFFIEIGDYDQAIRLLEQNIDKEHEITPVPQLYLFDLYRRTGRKAEYERLLSEFHTRFNVHIPTWEDSASGQRELMDYSRAMEQICRAWRTSDALTMLESLLVDDTRGQRMGFDLPAYRDIVFLYGIARQIMAEAGDMPDHLASGAAPGFVDSQVDFELPGSAANSDQRVASELDMLRSTGGEGASPRKEWPSTVQLQAHERPTADDFEFIDLGALDGGETAAADGSKGSGGSEGASANAGNSIEFTLEDKPPKAT